MLYKPVLGGEAGDVMNRLGDLNKPGLLFYFR